jgi:hypothetical protein
MEDWVGGGSQAGVGGRASPGCGAVHSAVCGGGKAGAKGQSRHHDRSPAPAGGRSAEQLHQMALAELEMEDPPPPSSGPTQVRKHRNNK